jgi:uncharacterized protein (DUF1800 family)
VALTRFWFDRMATVPSPLQEKLALFWHAHLATSQSKVSHWAAMYDQNALFRTAGAGSGRPTPTASSPPRIRASTSSAAIPAIPPPRRRLGR